MMPGRLQGKVAMITGGNSGIGEATAHRFAQEGATVVLVARHAPEGYAVQHALREAGGEDCFIPCDVSDRGAVDAAVATARATFAEESDAEWERVLRVNLTGTFLMCR